MITPWHKTYDQHRRPTAIELEATWRTYFMIKEVCRDLHRIAEQKEKNQEKQVEQKK